MEVILLKNYNNLGKAGDLVDVAPGFGNNHLLPKGIAKLATSGNKKHVAHLLKQLAQKDAELKTIAVSIQKKLADRTFELKVQAAETGKIFGAVTPDQVKVMLATHQIDIEVEQIKFASPVKEAGLHKITLMLHPDIAPSIECNVVAAG